MGPHTTLGKVYGWSKYQKWALKIDKSAIFLLLFYNFRRKNGADKAIQLKLNKEDMGPKHCLYKLKQ